MYVEAIAPVPGSYPTPNQGEALCRHGMTILESGQVDGAALRRYVVGHGVSDISIRGAADCLA
jgi:hypothetical protein